VTVVGVGEVGIHARLRRCDLRSKRPRLFGPGEESVLVQRQRHRKSLRLPWLAKQGAVVVVRLARQEGSLVAHAGGSRYGSHASIDARKPLAAS